MPDYRVEWADWPQDHAGLTALRTEVFVGEQKVPVDLEMDEFDAVALHVKAMDQDNRLVGTARLLPNHYVGRMCVARACRRQGVASRMMQLIIDHASAHGFDALHLNAQVSALPFYQGFGFVADSDVFIEAGIEHKHMTLDLAKHL